MVQVKKIVDSSVVNRLKKIRDDFSDFGRKFYKQARMSTRTRNAAALHHENTEYEESWGDIPIECKTENANLIGSLLENGNHMPCIDFDIPIRIYKSSSGNNHLYIDKSCTSKQYEALLKAFVDCGFVEKGILNCFLRKKQTFLRPPWIKKIDKENL